MKRGNLRATCKTNTIHIFFKPIQYYIFLVGSYVSGNISKVYTSNIPVTILGEWKSRQ